MLSIFDDQLCISTEIKTKQTLVRERIQAKRSPAVILDMTHVLKNLS